MTVPVSYYLILSAMVFLTGIVGVLIRRNIIAILLSVELMLNATNINFVAFSEHLQDLGGQVFVFFALTVAAAEVAVGLAIIIALHRSKSSINVEEFQSHEVVIDLLYALIPLLPLAAFVILGLAGSRIKDRAHLVAVPAVLMSCALSIVAFVEVANGAVISVPLYAWITSGSLDVHIGLYIDRLTAVMLLLVTIVSSLVHVYTIGYMHGDPGYARFFAYIALFTFSMLMLVLADNLLQLFVFWEAVGLCSYLLIGHWYERASACSAATKAFIVNRVGDFGFMLGLLLVWYTFGSLNYLEVFPAAYEATNLSMNVLGPFGGTWDISVFTLICLLLFMGAMGKSAQVPLHVWLPDAMEGPTPISALIHAATMVTAGVFMVARLAPLYNLSPIAMNVVALVGGADDGLRRHDCAHANRYQAGRRLFDGESAGLHGHGLRVGRLCLRHVPSPDAWRLQSPALFGLRLRHHRLAP